MFVREILHLKDNALKTLEPGALLEHAAAHMKLEHVGALLVCDADGRLEGVLSERDVVHAVVDHGPRALGELARDFVHGQSVTCTTDDTLASVARKMTAARVRHVPVLEAGKVVGVVSIGDVVKARFEEMELESATLRDLAAAHQMAS